MKHQKYIHRLLPIVMIGLLLASCNNSTEVVEDRVTKTASDTTEIVIYKAPDCDCCSNWAGHLREAGFTVVENLRDDMSAIRVKYGVPEKLASCHTATVDGYAIEGHVPADDVARLLKERPDNVVGLSAPGMPLESPGMQEKGMPPKNYNILAFDKDGKSHVFNRY